jgi:hypothetical protein
MVVGKAPWWMGQTERTSFLTVEVFLSHSSRDCPASSPFSGGPAAELGGGPSNGRRDPDAQIPLGIDQGEELFTVTEADRQEMAALLSAAAAIESGCQQGCQQCKKGAGQARPITQPQTRERGPSRPHGSFG